MDGWNGITSEEKINALRSLVKNLHYSRFNVEQEMAAEERIETPIEQTLYQYQITLNNIDAKIAYYMEQIATIEAQLTGE